ncbi:MAG: NUDIX domain-containing protein, partial [Ignavibacteriae bacterium]|nr:NUDIX domain-containing protein [Ignavibacteriota bacterium]
VWLAVRREIKNSNEFEYLIGKRLKNPFYGVKGFITGKLEYGESVYEGAKRELMEEAGLKGEPKLIHIQHYTNKDEATDLVIEDKFFFLCLIDNPVGEVVQNNEVELEWMVEADFKNKIRKTAGSIDEFLRIIKLTKKSDGNITFSEKQMYPKNF